MQSSLIILLIFCALLAAQGFYFGFIKPPRTLAWLQQSTFIIMTFMLIPFLIVVLIQQQGDIEKLAQTGFMPHPAITKSVGLTGESTWVFEIDASENEVRDFYKNPENTGDWKLTIDTGVMMIFSLDSQKMTIGYREGRGANTLSYMLSEESNNQALD